MFLVAPTQAFCHGTVLRIYARFANGARRRDPDREPLYAAAQDSPFSTTRCMTSPNVSISSSVA